MPLRAAQFRPLRTLAQGLLLALVMAAPCATSAAAQGAEVRRRVLIVLNNDSFTATQATIERALRETLKEGSPAPVETYSEYVGNTRAGTDYEQEFVALLRRKYEGKKFDVIFSIGQFPTSIMLRNRDELFPGTPIVFLTIDQRLVAGLYPAPGLTGVWGEINYKQNLELALALHPGTKRVVSIHGVSETDKGWAARAQEDFRAQQPGLEFIYLTGLTTEEMRKELGGLPPDTVVYFVSSIRDKAGNIYESPDYLRQVAPSSVAPIYGNTDALLGGGIVGGSLLSFEALGTEGGRVGLRLLAGEKPEEIAAAAVPSVAMFDWRELRRWGIGEQRLPPGSVVRFKTPSFWDLYKWHVIGLITLSVVEALLIAGLLVARARRRRAEMESARLARVAEEDRRHLDEVVSNVPGIVWESRFDPDTGARKTLFISQYVEKLLGYSVEEWVSTPGLSNETIVEEDRERVERETRALIESGEERVIQFRRTAKDGRVVWVESTIRPIVNGGGKTAGLRGVSMDVTEKKLAEEAKRQSEERNRATLRAIPDLMFLQRRDGVYLDYYARDRKELYVQPEEFVGKSVRDVMPPELAEKFMDCFGRVAESGDLQVVEYALPMGGQECWYEARLVPSGENILSVVRDISERKRAEEQLRESEERFRVLADSSPVLIWVNGMRGCEFVNRGYLEYLGRSMEEVTGDGWNWTEAIHPDDVESYLGAYLAAFEAREKFEAQFRFRRADGEYRWFKSNGLPRLTPDGKFLGYVGSSADVTDIKNSEEALRQSEARLRLAQEAARVGAWEWNTRTGASVWSEMIWRLLGLEPGDGETTLDRFTQFIHPEDRDRVMRKADELIAEGGDYSDEFRIVRRDGEVRWVASMGRLMRSEDGRTERMIGVNIDITERKDAEAALRESEARFRNMADTVPAMIWVSGADKLCTYFNRPWLEFTGRSMEEELGYGWAEGIHPDDYARSLETYNAAFDRREPFRMEYRLRYSDGMYRWVFDTGIPQFSSGGEFLGYIGSCVDITDRKAAEEARRGMVEELKVTLEEVNLLKNRLQEENIYLREEIKLEHNFSEIVGRSDAIKYLLHKIEQVAPTDSTVLITGETGTGKELVARAVHSESPRRGRPLVKVNCAALTPTLIESELFGHEKGAFTGAASRKIGRFELANGATIFLDEIGELPPDLQVKLLRVIQEGEFERLGGTRTIKVDVRIIAATNRNLWDEIQKGRFREDLWYRLNVFPITTPPLRQRLEDVPLLVEHFAGVFATKMGKKITSVSPATLDTLRHYSWPGNVRELANVIERAVINSHGPVLHVSNISETKGDAARPGADKTLEAVEREYIINVLANTDWKIEGPAGAAKVLGLHPSTLRTRMAKLNIRKPQPGTVGGDNGSFTS